ncbi:CTD kinase subunit gamma CTK3-domain-containing protein [Boletus reticuloceps]|uniref:CTD kinase subunit gamma CTK3-domain-containing protein n=1 Tax=Boletus reticuloceps TaxID=495285 RepID=A0A8I3A6T6_9AGAM|nr:CTD kinase subunit gamma CTK3-domain-containing protein [Boletus reticuloceps]
MDPFEVRMQFLGLLRKLNATQQSIQKVVGYALKYFSKCGEDLWECIIEECQKGSINHRINILYFLDSLCESSLLAKAHQPIPAESSSHAKQENTSFYVDYVSRDLRQIVECVVPVGRQGLPNLTSTKQVRTSVLFLKTCTDDKPQILENWRTKRIIEPQRVDEVMQVLSSRQTQPTESSIASVSAPTSQPPPSRGPGAGNDAHLSRGEIFRRIEEDRERHKRLRERRWVQAQPQVLSHSYPSHHSQPHHPAAGSGPGSSLGTTGYTAYALASFLPLSESENAALALDIEFENEWDATSDWNEDDVEAVMEERELCYPHLRRRGEEEGQGEGHVERAEELAEGEGGEEPMDLS